MIDYLDYIVRDHTIQRGQNRAHMIYDFPDPERTRLDTSHKVADNVQLLLSLAGWQRAHMDNGLVSYAHLI